MRISAVGLQGMKPGRQSVRDPRLDEVDELVRAKKKTYVQVEVVGEDSALTADAILCARDAVMDLLLRDLEFVETRLARSEDESEKALLSRIRVALEREQCVSSLPLTDRERQVAGSYSLHTLRPVVECNAGEVPDSGPLLNRALRESGYISFFTA